MTNFTYTVPDGSTDHGNPTLLCIPPKWYDYLIFFFANYFAHAATIVNFPGQGPYETLLAILWALFTPASGLRRALKVIRRRPALTRHDALQQAVRAGALCMVVKKEEGSDAGRWRPSGTDRLYTVVRITVPRASDGESAAADARPDRLVAPAPDRRNWWECSETELRVADDTKINGSFRFPPGSAYRFGKVPTKATLKFKKQMPPPADRVDSRAWAMRAITAIMRRGPGASVYKTLEPNAPPPEQEQQPYLSASYNIPKLIISLIQAIWATITLYQTRGDQITEYGYAAFGLTVAQYAWMSILNTIANLLSPEYPAMFIVRTDTMAEAEEREGCFFSGEIEVELNPESEPIAEHSDFGVAGWTLLLGMVPLIVVGALSHFQNGGSTTTQRGFTMSWLILSIVYGNMVGDDILADTLGSAMLILAIAPVGGMVVVGLMIRDFGICTVIG